MPVSFTKQNLNSIKQKKKGFRPRRKEKSSWPETQLRWKNIRPGLADGVQRKWSLKLVGRWLAKQGIPDCGSRVWRAAFGLFKCWAPHNPIFLPNTGTQSLQRQRWKTLYECVSACALFPLRRCWSLALVRPLGKLRRYCGWTMYNDECLRVRG